MPHSSNFSRENARFFDVDGLDGKAAAVGDEPGCRVITEQPGIEESKAKPVEFGTSVWEDARPAGSNVCRTLAPAPLHSPTLPLS